MSVAAIESADEQGVAERQGCRADSPLRLMSDVLFRQGNTVCIEHAGQTYWLRLTRGNKLILTK